MGIHKKVTPGEKKIVLKYFLVVTKFYARASGSKVSFRWGKIGHFHLGVIFVIMGVFFGYVSVYFILLIFDSV